MVHLTYHPVVHRDVVLRLADPLDDADAIAALYAPYVRSSVASLEEVEPRPDEMARRIERTLAWAPWLVACVGDVVVGYAYAARHRERAGYRWAVDLSVYVAADRQGQGVGRRLYAALLPILRHQGFQHAYAGITPPNPASFALHAAAGMSPLGTYERVGHKMGTWWSVTWLGMQFHDVLPGSPPEPLALPDLVATPAGRAAVARILDAAARGS